MFRSPRAGDLAKAAAVFAAEEKALLGVARTGIDELRDAWRSLDLEAGSWLVENSDAEPVAFGGIFGGGAFSARIAVHPEYVGRGISTDLIGRACRRVQEIGGSSLRVGMYANNARARALMDGLGFRETQRLYRMEIDFDRTPIVRARAEGITIATFRPSDAESFLGTLNEAFNDDPTWARMDFEQWRRVRLQAPDTDTSLWFLAWDGDEAAGAIRCDQRRFGGGFVGALGVREPWRGRGIGAALLSHALADYDRRGVRRVGLIVDAQNRTGATRLYERAGMRVVVEHVVLEKALARDAPDASVLRSRRAS
jgi:mycothiol synthase